MKVINLWAGPGAGKSTIASGVFYHLKREQTCNVELVTEYAKDMTWERRVNVLQDQLYITAKQNRRLARLLDHNIDYVVTDAPLLLGMQYITPDFLGGSFAKLLEELWSSYDNINFFIERTKRYNPVGRSQSEDEALVIDRNILKFLYNNKIPFTNIKGDEFAVENILEKRFI